MMWDNGTHNAYRYGDGECYDVEQTDERRILDGSELIEIGVQVERGKVFQMPFFFQICFQYMRIIITWRM